MNAGAYFEHASISGGSLSYRVGANYRLSQAQTVRASWSTGTRTPDIQEQRANWSYLGANATPPLNGSSDLRFFQSARSPGGLRSERIRSAELGYILNIPSWGVLFDARLFHDRLSSLISQKLQLSDFSPTNGNGLRMSGLELQASVELSSTWSGFGQYAYLRNYDATTPLEQTQFSRHSGALGVSHAFGDGWRLSFAYYAAAGDGIGQRSFGREDITVTKQFQLGLSRTSVSMILRRLDNKTVSYYRDTASILQSSYKDRLQLFGQVSLNF